MKKVYICSPWKGNHEPTESRSSVEKKHEIIVRAICRKVALQGNIPIAPHLFFTRFLDDGNTTERKIGQKLGLFQLKECDEMLVYLHCCGISEGMQAEMNFATGKRIPIYKFKIL